MRVGGQIKSNSYETSCERTRVKDTEHCRSNESDGGFERLMKLSSVILVKILKEKSISVLTFWEPNRFTCKLLFVLFSFKNLMKLCSVILGKILIEESIYCLVGTTELYLQKGHICFVLFHEAL